MSAMPPLDLKENAVRSDTSHPAGKHIQLTRYPDVSGSSADGDVDISRETRRHLRGTNPTVEELRPLGQDGEHLTLAQRHQ